MPGRTISRRSAVGGGAENINNDRDEKILVGKGKSQEFLGRKQQPMSDEAAIHVR